jgi:hypothetical protein
MIKMKCALELMAVKAKAELEWEMEQKRLDEECRKEQENLITRTFNYCENVIGVELEKQASKMLMPKFQVELVERKDRLGRVRVHPLKMTSYQYARSTGKVSREPDMKISYDLNTMREYLEKHCLTVSIDDSRYSCYGDGERYCLLITVKV